MKKTFFLIFFSFFACNNETPTQQPVQNQPEVKASSATSVLNAPANYINNTVRQIDKAKEAAALMEKNQQQRLDAAEGK